MNTIIDHIGLTVSHYEKSKSFYISLLKPLEISLLTEDSGFAGFGKNESPIASFWIHQDQPLTTKAHVAFLATTKRQVHLFHEAGLMLGGQDNGQPGYRKIYHPNYYAAFIIDPDGHNIEAVCYHAD